MEYTYYIGLLFYEDEHYYSMVKDPTFMEKDSNGLPASIQLDGWFSYDGFRKGNVCYEVEVNSLIIVPPPRPLDRIRGGIVFRQDDILRDARKNKWSQTSGTN